MAEKNKTDDQVMVAEVAQDEQAEQKGPGAARRGLKKMSKAAEARAAAGRVRVTSGTYNEELEVIGKSVVEVVREYGDRLDMHPESVAVVNGGQVKADYIIAENDTLLFVRPSGEKGCI